jgi:uncharacterized repeat protein (TIGR01451 family)
MNLKFIIPALVAGFVVFAAPATAVSGNDALELAGDVKLVKAETDGEGNVTQTLVDPATVVPGDQLIFSTRFNNPTDQTIANFVLTNPLPSAVMLSPMADPALDVSIDGGQTWGRLSELMIEAEGAVMRPATHRDVTHIRWKLDAVAPQESGTLEYPAIVR